MHRPARLALLVLAISVVGVACGGLVPSQSNDVDPSIEGQWSITAYLNADGELIPPLENTSPFLAISQDGLSGTTGCNTFFSPLTAAPGGTWSTGEIGMTLIGCPPDLSAQEQAIASAIQSADSWDVAGDTADLAAAGIVVMQMERLSTELAGTEWAVTGINNGKGGVVSIAAGTEPTMAFAADRLSGTTGCNTFTTTYSVGDTEIVVGPIAATRMLCNEDGVMDQENQMLAALERSVSYEISGTTLTLRSEDQSTQVVATGSSEG